MSDADLALSILRKIAADQFTCLVSEDGSVALDTGWVDIEPDEMELLRRLGARPAH